MSTIAATPGLTVPRRRPAPARPVAAAPVAAPAAPVRLTRRGRLVLTVLFLVVVSVVLTVFGATSAATGSRRISSAITSTARPSRDRSAASGRSSPTD